jgi:hypothetical protein
MAEKKIENLILTAQKSEITEHLVYQKLSQSARDSHLLVVPSSDILDAIAHTAAQLDSAEVIAGSSPVLRPEGQAERFRKAWTKLRDQPKHEVRFRIIDPDGSMQDFLILAPPARTTGKTTPRHD